MNRIYQLIICCVLSLLGLSGQAANLIERTEPETPSFGPGSLTVNDFEATATDFELGACYVLYNVGSQAFFGEGNAWGTQASISTETPLLVRFTVPAGMTSEDNALLFNDYANSKTAWKLVFFDNDHQMFVDLGSQANYYWQVVSTGNQTYRLQASPKNPVYNPDAYTGFVGLDVTENPDNTALHPFLDEADGHYIDWQFFAVPEWTSYYKEKDAYDVAMKLKAQIEVCEAAGLDVSAAVAVYNNLNATAAELNAAIEALKEALAATISGGTADNPADATKLITNPNFDDASYDGWLGTAPNMVGSGSHGPANVAEVYNNTFDTYQDLSGLPDGLYALRAKTAFRGSWEDYKSGRSSAAKLYATVGDMTFETPFNNIWSCLNTVSMAGNTYFGTYAAENSREEDGVIYYSPDDPSAFRLYAEKGYYDTELYFEVVGGNARIGIKNEAMCGDGCDNWSIFDTFTLKYYGKDATDMTDMLQTPSFEKDGTNSIDGWVATGWKFGNDDQLFCLALESWESVFHIYQDVAGLPDGIYTLKVNGWQRTASPTYLYAESASMSYSKELIKLEEGLPEGYTAPNSLSAAVEQFSEDVFMNTLVLKVVDGKLRFGVRKDEVASDDWIVLDNFQLWYHGASVAPEGWTEQLTNGDAEGSDLTCFIGRDGDGNGDQPARIVEGAGFNGSRAFTIHSVAEPENDWDSQFFIYTPNHLWKANDHYRLTFKVRADQPAHVTAQSHYTPGDYIWYQIADGGYDVTTDWQEFNYEGEIFSDQVGDRDGLHCIAFNLNELRGEDNNYYFDDISWMSYNGNVFGPDWTDIIVNGDMEGESTECFYVTEQGVGGPFLAVTTAGKGKDGGKAIVLNSADNPAEDWDTQFFIRLPYQLPAGTKYRVSFDYKANKEGDFDTQAHAEPGDYIHWVCIGSGNFTTDWQTYEHSGTISAEMSTEEKPMQTIAFNLALNKAATEFIFDNVKFEIEKSVADALTPNPAENPVPYPVSNEDPELVAPEGWHSVIANGNLAGDEVANFFTKENSGDPTPAVITAGAGKNNSRGIIINTPDDPAYDWDAQFFIRANETIPAGANIHVEFDYKASQDADFDTQSHTEPGNYIHWYCVGSETATTEWKHFSAEVEVSANAEGDKANSTNEMPFQTIAFNLSKVKTSTTFYFDNITFWVTDSAQEFPISEGRYYLKNMVTGLFWGAANEWGTTASLVKHPEYVTLHQQPNGTYTMETQVTNGGESYFFNGEYMDQTPPCNLSIMSRGDGTYTIADGDNYFGYDGVSNVLGKWLDSNSENARWQIISEDDMNESLHAATWDAPVDATFFILDPNFSRNHRYQDAWMMEADNQELCGGTNENKCAESFHSEFTLSQRIENVPNGYYRLTAQGFYRQDGQDNANLPYFYINNVKALFPAKGELPDYDGDGGESMGDASVEFSNGAYTINPIYVQVTDGVITLGAKLENNTELWAIWDNFELYYYGIDMPEDTHTYKTFAENTVLLTTVDNIEQERQQLNWIEGGTYQAMKNGTINPQNGQEGTAIVTEGIMLMNGNDDKTLQTYVTGVECVWAYGCTAGSTRRDLVVTAYDKMGQIVATSRGTSSNYKSVMVQLNGLDPNQQYRIDYTGCTAGGDTGADVVLHGIRFVKKYYEDKTFADANLKYHTTSENTVEVVGYVNPPATFSMSGSVSNGGVSYSVTAIADQAFSGCSTINRITLPSTVTSIGWQAFIFSSMSYISIPNSVTSIGEQAFACEYLSTISVNSGNPVYSSSSGVLFNKDKTTLIRYPANKAAIYYDIPETVESIDVTAFGGAKLLEYITIPASVKNAWWAPFENCPALVTVVCKSSTPADLADNSFSSETFSKATLWVPQGALTAYSNHALWKQFLKKKTIPTSIKVSAKDRWITYGDNLSATYEYIISDGPRCGEPSITSSATSNSNAGSYDIVPQKGTLHSASALEYVNGTLTINKTQLTVSVGNYTKYRYEENPTFKISYSGFKFQQNENSLTQKPTAYCEARVGSPAGTYPIILSGGESPNYTFSYVNGTLTVKEAYNLIISVIGGGCVNYNGEQVSSYSSFNVKEGSEVTMRFVPDDGFKLETVTNNGVDITNSIVGNSYTINNMNKDINIVASFVESQGTFREGDVSYKILSASDKTVIVNKSTTYKGHIVVPSSVNYKNQTWSVVGIADNAFNNCSSLVSIELPSSLLSSNVGISLFTGCTSLAAIIWNADFRLTSSRLGAIDNPNLLYYVSKRTNAPADISNIIVGNTATSITLQDVNGDGGSFYCPKAFTATKISYTHHYSMTSAIGGIQGWETLALPFTVQKIEHEKWGTIVPFANYNAGQASQRPFWLYTYGSSGFVRSSKIEANKPYLICMPNNEEYDQEYCLAGNVTFSAENAWVETTDKATGIKRGNKSFTPVFSKEKKSNDFYVLNSVNVLHSETGGYTPGSVFVSGLRDVSPFEAYLTTSASGARTVMEIDFADTSDIEALFNDYEWMRNGRQRVYNLNGQLVVQTDNKEELQDALKRLPKGIYIINGKKIQIK